MTRDEMIAMAQEVGAEVFCFDENQPWLFYPDDLERFAALVEQHLIASGYRKCAENQKATQHCGMVEQAVKDEKEACAKVCDDAVNSISETADAEVREVATNVCINLGRAIRARGTP